MNSFNTIGGINANGGIGLGGLDYSTLKSQSEIPTIQKTDDDAKLKEQCDAFESLLLKFVLDTALKMDDGLLPKEPGHEIYQAMYKENLADSLSGNFGYSELLYDYLKEVQAGRRA